MAAYTDSKKEREKEKKIDQRNKRRPEKQQQVSPIKKAWPDTEVDLPQYPTPPSDFPDSDVEETIISQGAQATMSRRLKPPPRVHLQALAEDEGKESDEEELGDSDGEHETARSQRPTGFPSLEELPKWFPRNIKKIYEVDRHGGALSFKVS